MNEKAFATSLFKYERAASRQVSVGTLPMGGANPIRVQSMTTTDTNDVEESVAQSLRIAQAGGELVRLTTQGEREAKNIGLVKEALVKGGCTTPIVADIHFNSKAAETAAALVDAVRINPGNYTGEAKRFREDADKLTDEEWHALIVEHIRPLVDICKAHNTAIRIGVNHGSLSDRVMARYGDTPQGMVTSCTEYLDAFEELGFRNIVISIKSSNTRVMVETVRLLSATMRERETFYPLHLGVTEAGSDAEGRIKSAAGIGALMADGLGDTIRVSLTEAPEAEIPVAKMLVELTERLADAQPVAEVATDKYSPYAYRRRESTEVKIGGNSTEGNEDGAIGGTQAPVVVVATADALPAEADWKMDADGKNITTRNGETMAVVSANNIPSGDKPFAVNLSLDELNDTVAAALKAAEGRAIVMGRCTTGNHAAELRALSLELQNRGIRAPFIATYTSATAKELTSFQIEASAAMGLLFIDGLADGLCLCAPALPAGQAAATGDLLLQATRARFSHTEFISCPACGRTLYDIQSAVKIIKERLGHLDGLKIGVMGCIVNGIGEMADADYGYVGARRGAISLYRGKEVVKKNMPQEEALDALTEIIKADGKWKEPKK